MGNTESYIREDGACVYTEFSKIHRGDDKPAVKRKNMCGSLEEWWTNGIRHRENGKSAVIKIIFLNGGGDIISTQEWWINGHKTRYLKTKNHISLIGKEHKLEEIIYGDNEMIKYSYTIDDANSETRIWYHDNGTIQTIIDNGITKNYNDKMGLCVPIGMNAYINDCAKRRCIPHNNFSGVQSIQPVIQNLMPKIHNIRKMPENISSLLNEEERECPICLEIIDTKEVYTSKECFHVYHEECLKDVEKCSICER